VTQSKTQPPKTKAPKTRAPRRTRGVLATRRPLMVFRGQSAALMLPVILGLMAVLATFFALQTTQKVFELQESIGLANSELTVFVPSTPGLTPSDTDPAVKRALDLLHNSAGLGRIEVLSREATRALIEGTLGSAIQPHVPLPSILSVKRARRGDLDVAALGVALDRAAPGSLLDDNAALRTNLQAARAAEMAKCAALLVTVLIVVSITAALVIGQSVEMQGEVIDVLYVAGASDRVILSQFVGFTLRSALLGVAVGALGGWTLQLAYWPRVLSEPNTLLPLQAPVMLVVILLLVLASVGSARWNVLRKLKRTF